MGGAAWTVSDGVNSFSWSETNFASNNLGASGASLAVTDASSDALDFHQSGTESLVSGGSVASGSDDFTWSQVGTDLYHIHESGGGRRTPTRST